MSHAATAIRAPAPTRRPTGPSAITDAEMDRRWAAVRSAMAREGLDWLVGTSGHPFGYQRWLTNRVGMPGTLMAIGTQGDVLLASHGDAVHHRAMNSYGVRHLVTPAHLNLARNSHAPALVEVMADSAPRRIGVLGLGYLAAATLEALRRLLPSVEIVDATDAIAPIKAVKSEVELACMRRASAMHEDAIDLLRQIARPGGMGADLLDEVRYSLCLAGSPAQTMMVGSAPPGAICRYAGPPERVLERGDQLAMLIEAAERDGYYSEAMPMVSLGPVPDALKRAFDHAVELQEILAAMARPGADPNEMMRVNDDFMRAHGYTPEGRLLGHAQGVDLVERPAMSPTGETMPLAANMVISIHPTTHGETAWGFPVNMSFLVTDGAPQRMLRTPQTIPVV